MEKCLSELKVGSTVTTPDGKELYKIVEHYSYFDGYDIPGTPYADGEMKRVVRCTDLKTGRIMRLHVRKKVVLLASPAT